MQGLKLNKKFERENQQAGMMPTGRSFSIVVSALMFMALAVFVPGRPGASPRLGAAPALFASSANPGFDARPRIPSDGEGPPLRTALRLRKPKDTDGDGVEDRKDECPDTPVSAVVDLRGCPTDEDMDGVFDGIDQCAETARGATVDAAGCPRDSDGDGVLDGLDSCPDTDPRAMVHADGCPYDTDGDGVFDGIDTCPDTPTGAVADQRGCPLDTDGDDVPDGLDKCPDTGLDDETDESGCSRVQRGEIVLPSIAFGLGSTAILPGSSPELDEVAKILKQNPNLKVEIGGHTDNDGPARLNRKISLLRAKAVKAYLVSQGVPASRLTTKGYGEVHPIASNRDAKGRAKNRRIEFKILEPPADSSPPDTAKEGGEPEPEGQAQPPSQ